jgi:hypothetical protein
MTISVFSLSREAFTKVGEALGIVLRDELGVELGSKISKIQTMYFIMTVLLATVVAFE